MVAPTLALAMAMTVSTSALVALPFPSASRSSRMRTCRHCSASITPSSDAVDEDADPYSALFTPVAGAVMGRTENGDATFPLSRSMVVAIKTATATVLTVHLLEHLIDHGSFVSDPALSDVLVVLTWLVISSTLLAWAMAASDPPRVGSASDLNPLPPLSDAEAADPPPPTIIQFSSYLYSPPPGLAELLSCIDSSDRLTLICAGAVCEAMGANHVTDIVGLGHERHFAQELARLVNGNFVQGTVAMSPTKRDMLLEVLTAMSARHVGVVWTKSDQDEAVKSLKARALSERMFRQSESTPRTLEGLN